ncbi:MAG: hypothetical protein HKN21_07225, partial [Candidatus Eisenbacteria bacterium]|nr:hypothetical protein [Candidatus Eisenbacteria bacterium]
QAYDLYLRAAAYLEWGLGPTADDLRTGIGFLEEAVALDPEFALGFASLSQARSALYYVLRTNELQYAEQARIDALHAIDLNPNLAKGHLAMGLYHYRSSLDYESALLALGVARRLAPRNAEILSWTGTIKKRQAKFDEAAALLEVALSFDPRNLTILGELAVVERCRGNYALVLEYLDRSIAIKPSANAREYRASHILTSTGDTRPMREFLSQAPESFRIREDWSELLEMEGDLEGAIGHRQTLVDSSTDDSQRASQLVKLARLYWLKGNHAESQRLAAMAIPKLGEADDWVNLIHLAMAHAISGQPQDVRLQIERALATPRLQRDLLSRCRAQLVLAEVYVMNGDPAAAVRTLKERLRVTQEVSAKNLMMRPIFNSLHEREDFKALGDATKP